MRQLKRTSRGGWRRRDVLASLSSLALPTWASGASASGASRPVLGRGIYVSQTTLFDKAKLQGLLRLCSAFQVNTMVVDLWSRSRNYDRSIREIQAANVAYVPRIQVFPGGGTKETVLRRDYWDKRLRSVDAGLSLGARHLQLDYIRYDTNRKPNRQNAFDILRVLQFFSEHIHAEGATFEIDVFGDAAGGPSDTIGQDLRLLAPLVDAVCPMVYPSHYEPRETAWKMPSQIARTSVKSALNQLGESPPPVKVYIEMFHPRRAMTDSQRAEYIRAQVQGGVAGGATGWYAWSSTNSYGLLFDLLGAYGVQFESLPASTRR